MTASRAFGGDLEDLMPHCHARVAAPEIARFRHNDPFRQSLWSSPASFGAHLIDLQPFWQRVRARAGLKDARIHDLRHTFASAAATGQGLPMIGKLFGHTQVQTTARYAHMAADHVREAADQVSVAIAKAVFCEAVEGRVVNS